MSFFDLVRRSENGMLLLLLILLLLLNLSCVFKVKCSNLFDISYETINDLDVPGDFIAVTLLGNNNTEINYYTKFIFDY